MYGITKYNHGRNYYEGEDYQSSTVKYKSNDYYMGGDVDYNNYKTVAGEYNQNSYYNGCDV